MKKFFKKIWGKWKKIALVIGRFNTKVILTIIFFLVLAPIGYIFRLFGWDPLDLKQKNKPDSNWKEVKTAEPDLESMKRQS